MARILARLRQVQDNVDLEDDDGALFWLVVADQFEKKGVRPFPVDRWEIP